MSKILFQHINEFVSMEGQEFEEIISYFTRRDVDKKELLMHPGDTVLHDHFVLSGCLQMYFIDMEGVKHTVQFALQGWWLADYLALQTKKPTEFFIQAVKKTAILSISSTKRDELFKAFPKLESYFRTVYQIAYGSYQTRMKYILSYSKEEIYFKFRDAFPDFVNSIPQYLIANYLGLSPEYISKLRRKRIS
ncbi:Crp/Fnr family transcriptional regulator [Sphingobacterium gobiense]|uniref:Crp/Fnr family transcriptional regulator n=1 Tax=Sphingobacterium gobiense TaxID=1382456 RepID=A0A2S9JW33_9SPHI|nr:Crp/Fnr family transcriptional regulator [Sphingobacterium gobiense]PRD57498.1 Crp/Fnr family transcriptional regulator [Sphingobacterium gobiense]